MTGSSYGSGTSSDFATVAYRPDGSLLWPNLLDGAARYNGPGNGVDAAFSIAVWKDPSDGEDYVYVTGSSYGSGTSSDFATIRYWSLKDTTPPIISGLPAPNSILWPPNNKLVRVAIVTATDALSGLASFNVTGTSSEPSDPNNPDIVITGSGLGPRTVQLRAQRLGTGKGRTYTLTATASDLAGNTTTVKTTVIVPHDQGK